MFSEVPNLFKYSQNTCFRDMVFRNNGMHSFETLFSKCSLQFQIVLNIVRMHALETLFSKKNCSSKSFQIVSECILERHCFHFFSAIPNRFKYCQNACFRDIVFQKKSAVSNTVSCHIFENAIALIVFILRKNKHHAWTKTMLLKLGRT